MCYTAFLYHINRDHIEFSFQVSRRDTSLFFYALNNTTEEGRGGGGGEANSELVVKLDLGEVAHSNLLDIVDDVFVVLKGVPLLALNCRCPKRENYYI